jgi:hypothetical protein
MRPHGKTKLGFFPLPAPEAEGLKNRLAFALEFSALDPCVGDGVGIEIDTYRVEPATARRVLTLS